MNKAYERPEVLSKINIALLEHLSADHDISSAQIDRMHELGAELAEAKADLQCDLDTAKHRVLLPQQKGQTELDRKLHMAASVARMQADYDLMCDLSLRLSEWSNLTCVRLSRSK